MEDEDDEQQHNQPADGWLFRDVSDAQLAAMDDAQLADRGAQLADRGAQLAVWKRRVEEEQLRVEVEKGIRRRSDEARLANDEARRQSAEHDDSYRLSAYLASERLPSAPAAHQHSEPDGPGSGIVLAPREEVRVKKERSTVVEATPERL